MDLQKVQYLCEIAYMYWASKQYQSHWYFFQNSWKDYEDMVKFYEMIYNEAKHMDDYTGLLYNINELLENKTNKVNNLFMEFLSS